MARHSFRWRRRSLREPAVSFQPSAISLEPQALKRVVNRDGSIAALKRLRHQDQGIPDIV
jgi:hypothetical protein